MCCDHMLCASCARPVAEARCGVCRLARSQLHQSQPVPLAALVAIGVVLLALMALLGNHLAA